MVSNRDSQGVWVIDGIRYSAVKVDGFECDLTKLKRGQRVASGGLGANFYWLYTPIEEDVAEPIPYTRSSSYEGPKINDLATEFGLTHNATNLLMLMKAVKIGREAAELELRQREEWVKVEDAMPEDRIEVDVWFDVYASPMSFGMSDTWREPNAYRKDGKWVHRYHGEEAELNARYITHWRLLPAPPKEGL